jgi:hypothetical protein
VGSQEGALHVGLIGAGRIGAFHARTLSGLAGVLDPGSDTARTLTINVSDNCQPGSSIAVTRLRVNVVSVR